MARLSVFLLGTLQVTLDGVPVPGIKYHKAKALLAYLAVEADRPHLRDTLAGLFWPDLPDDIALKNLSQALSNLRRVLGDSAPGRPFLLVEQEAIQFNPASDHALDVARFDQLVATCEAHMHRSIESCSACAARLEQAACLYRDDFLTHFAAGAGTPFEEWAEAKREVLRQQALRVFAHLAAYHERHANDAQAEALARRQLALDPWREAAHRQLMRLWAQTDQRNAALAHYNDFRARLAQELNALPEWETTALYEQLRTAHTDEHGARVGPGRRVRLPARLEPFIGRERELSEIATVLEQPDQRLISLVGPGGIGKTRLAIEAARRHAPDFADGVFFVPLAAASAAERVPGAVASALGLDTAGAPDPLQELMHALHNKEALLVLDSMEHLLADPAAEPALTHLIGDLLEQAAGVTLLVTSRERLRMTGEHMLDVPGLAVPPNRSEPRLEDYDAVKFFLACARRADPGFSLTPAVAGDVVDLCQRLEGLPLGIEMAAAWVSAIPCAELAAEIGRNLDFLHATTRDVPERQRSLRATFDYSWRLLSDEERSVFAPLCLFRGGFEREAARQVAGATAGLLTELANKSWVQRSSGDRYELHELVRQYGLAQLMASGAEAEARQRHAQYFCSLVEALAPMLGTSERQRGLERLGLEAGNLYAALDWDLSVHGNAEEGWRLSEALLQCGARRGWTGEANAWLPGGPAQEMKVPEFLRARALLQAGRAAIWTMNMPASRQLLTQAVELGRTLGDDWCVAWALSGLALYALWSLDPSAEVMLTESLTLLQKLGDEYGMACQLITLGMLSRARGDFDRAQAQFSESLALSEKLGDNHRIPDAICGLGKVARSRGDYARAAELYERALALDRAYGFQYDIAETIMEQGMLAHLQGDEEHARALLVESLKLYLEINNYGQIGYNLAWLGAVAAAQRQPREAARLLGAAAARFEASYRRLGVAEQAEFDRAVAAAHAQLDEAAFTAAWAEGQALTWEPAMELGLKSGPT